jgi:hypothetical protein
MARSLYSSRDCLLQADNNSQSLVQNPLGNFFLLDVLTRNRPLDSLSEGGDVFREASVMSCFGGENNQIIGHISFDIYHLSFCS